jgi:hypothetical protein
MLDVAELHHHLLHHGGGGCSIQRRGDGNDGILIKFLHEGIYSGLESYCFFPGYMVGFA